MQDHSDHSASNEKVNPFCSQIRRLVIHPDHPKGPYRPEKLLFIVIIKKKFE